MSEIEVEAETTTIETETVTVCDHCGLEVDDDEAIALVAGYEPVLSSSPELVILREAITDAIRPEYGKYGNVQVDFNPARAAKHLDVTYEAEMEVDVHPDCLEALFDATPNSEAIEYAALAREATADSNDDSGTETTRGRFPWVPVVGFIATAVLVIGGLVSGHEVLSFIALGVLGGSIFASAIWIREVFDGE